MRPDITHLTQQTMAALGMNFPLSMVTSDMRTKSIVEVRHLAMWLTRRCLGLSFTELAIQFNRRHHGTAMDAVRKIELLLLLHPTSFTAEIARRLEREHHPLNQMRPIVSTGARDVELSECGVRVELDLTVGDAAE